MYFEAELDRRDIIDEVLLKCYKLHIIRKERIKLMIDN